MPTKPLKISIIGDASKFNKSMDGVSGKLKSLGKRAIQTGAIIGAALGAGAFVVLKDGIGIASDIEESMSKLNVVFGESSEGIITFGDDSSKVLGISKSEYLAWSGSVGAALVSGGMDSETAADMTQGLVKTYADLASFHNDMPENVKNAWESAMRGSYEPVQKYMPFISETFVKEYGIANGMIDENTKKLSSNDRAIILNAISLDEELNPALDDFAETSGGLANQQRILAAQWDDMKAKIGEKLLPIVTKFVTWLNDEGIPKLERFGEKLSEWWTKAEPYLTRLKNYVQDVVIPKLQEIWDKTKPKLEALRKFIEDKLVPALVKVKDKLVEWWTKAWPKVEAFINGVVTGIETMVGWIEDIYQAFQDGDNEKANSFLDIVTALGEVGSAGLSLFVALLEELGEAWDNAWSTIRTAWEGNDEEMMESMDGFFTTMTETIELTLLTIAALIAGLEGLVTGDYENFWKRSNKLWDEGFESNQEISETGFNWQILGFTGMMGALLSTSKTGWDEINEGAEKDSIMWYNRISGLKEKTKTALAGAEEWLKTDGKKTITGLWNGAMEKWLDVKTWFEERKESVKSAIGTGSGWLKQIGREVVGGLWSGMIAKWNNFKGWLSARAAEVSSIWRKVLDINSPSGVFMDHGENIVKGLQIGIDKGFGALKTNVASAAYGLPDALLGTASASGGSSGSITINTTSQSSPHDIAREVSWALRSRGR